MSDRNPLISPARGMTLIVAGLLIAAAVALSLVRGNPGPLLILGIFAWAITRR